MHAFDLGMPPKSPASLLLLLEISVDISILARLLLFGVSCFNKQEAKKKRKELFRYSTLVQTMSLGNNVRNHFLSFAVVQAGCILRKLSKPRDTKASSARKVKIQSGAYVSRLEVVQRSERKYKFSPRC